MREEQDLIAHWFKGLIMNVQVLVAAMHQTDHSLLEKMNIHSDAIIGNQCEENRIENMQWNGHKIQYYSFAERGVGLNRNNSLMRADGDICLFADEDMRYYDDYAQIVKRAFEERPDADAIVFNIDIKGPNMGSRRNVASKRVRWFNALSYGASRLAVKTDSVKRENIMFHRCFGGGTMFSCGEDTLFIVDMLKHKLKIYTYPATIAQVDQNTSTWFSGYNKKYLYDKGVLFRAISKRWCSLLCLQALIRHSQMYKEAGLRFWEAYSFMKLGSKGFEKLVQYPDDI